MIKYKPIEINLFKMFIESLWLSLMIICIPGNIFLLVMTDSIGRTILHSLLLMYFTSVLTIKAFAWKIKNEKRGS
ncbi:hypothetical protein DFR56_103313 [Pseudogracilibacillus auburnensis]|uniref:Uncharacterized protein n=1 Tax=Pseudogracilibacillus auburnensis TaxID=1494959 RepID=A0A2V3W3D3_9BACI|nr:hypothetical protein DFR56_103313 [Pseudogracilibacillus auburnensis]